MKIVSLKIATVFFVLPIFTANVQAQIPKSQAQLEAEVRTNVLPRVENPIAAGIMELEAKKAIAENDALQAIVAGSTSQAEIQERLEEAPKALFYDNRFGASAEVVAQTFSEDAETVTTEFQGCQDLEHTYAELAIEPKIEVDACSAHVIYPGTLSGVCAKCLPSSNPYCGGCFWVYGDLVDYHFPTLKIDTSEQPYQSQYLEETEVKSKYAPENKRLMRELGTITALDNIKAVNKAAYETMKANEVEVAVPNISTDQLSEQFKEELQLNELADNLRTSVPDSSRIYSRFVPDPLNKATSGMWWVPHVAKSGAIFGTDLPPWLLLASRSGGSGMADISNLASPALMAKFAKFASRPGGMFSCVENNKARGKTASDLKLTLSKGINEGMIYPGVGNPNDDLCLRNIGERFPLTDTGRVNITDRTWSGIAKGLSLYQIEVGESDRQTFEEAKDKLLVLRNEKLKQESPTCEVLDKMTRVNIDYQTANVKQAKSGGENTVEVFTQFRGCWGFKGRDESYWTFIAKWNGQGPLRLQ